MSGILRVTDGTTSVNLLSKRVTGWHLFEWRPAVAGYKGDGIWQDPILAHNRRLTDYKFANAVETLTLHLVGNDQDRSARSIQTLIRLFQQAADYWTAEWSNTPVWLVARSKCETNTRYALIRAAHFEEIDDPYGVAFLERRPLMPELTLKIERGHWTESEPGTGTVIALSNPGRAATSSLHEVFVANKQNTAALTHIYVDDGGVFSANRVAATAYNLLPAVPAANDAVYFGCSTGGGKRFGSLVTDIAIAGSGLGDVIWEYSLGGGLWGSLTVQDNTNHDGVQDQVAFDTTGVKSISWWLPSLWDADTVNAVQAFWVRARVVGPVAAPSPPTQQNRPIYTILWPYVEIAADQVPGDIPALIQMLMRNESAGGGVGWSWAGAYPWFHFNALYWGLRSVSRGSAFTPFLNLSDEQNPAGVTGPTGTLVWVGTGGLVDRYDAPSGRALEMVPDPVFTYGEGYMPWVLDSTINGQYFGRYHAFLRVTRTGLEGDGSTLASLRVELMQGTVYYSGNLETIVPDAGAAEAQALIDLGAFSIPHSAIIAGEVIQNVTLTVYLRCNCTIYAYDLILLPVDEQAGHVYAAEDGAWCTRYDGGLGIPDTLKIDAIENPKTFLRSMMIKGSNVYEMCVYIGNGEAILQANSAQRLWFLHDNTDTDLGAHHQIITSPIIKRQARYLALRGDR